MNGVDPEVLALRAIIARQHDDLCSLQHQLLLMQDPSYRQWLDQLTYQAELARVQLDLFPNNRAH